MATAPKCKICGTAHWSNQPHAGASKAERPATKAVSLPKPQPVVAVVDDRDALIVSLRARVAELEALAAITEKRRAANRERMARVRSK